MRYTTHTLVRIDVIFSYLCTLLLQPLTQLCQECVAIYLSPYDTHRNDLYYHPCIKAFTIHTTICAWVLHKSQITFNQSVQRKTANSVDLKRFQLHIAEFSLVVTTVQRNSPSTSQSHSLQQKEYSSKRIPQLCLLIKSVLTSHSILDWIVLISFNNVNNTSSTQ